MKHLSTAILAILIAFVSSASEPRRGYRGFVDANVDLSFVDNYDEALVNAYYSLSTSHGFQFSPLLYVGAGLALERVYHGRWLSKIENPIFAHARVDMTFGKIPLYGDLRIGGVLFGDYRLYISPTVGYRLNWGRKMNLNFGLGMTFRGYGWSDTKTLHPQLAVRVGIDF